MHQILELPPVFRWLITLVFVAIIVILSIAPGKPQADDSVFVWLIVNTPTPLQKLMHLACYALIACLWMWTLEPVQSRPLRAGLAFLLTISLGATLEWLQTKVPGRFGTVLDVLLNALGAVVGLILAAFLL